MTASSSQAPNNDGEVCDGGCSNGLVTMCLVLDPPGCGAQDDPVDAVPEDDPPEGAQKSRRIGRPPLAADIVALIVRMARENPTWSRRRIASELAKLGHGVDKDTMAKYIPKQSPRPGRPSQTCGTFVRDHRVGTIAVDFLTVPTVTLTSCTFSSSNLWSAAGSCMSR